MTTRQTEEPNEVRVFVMAAFKVARHAALTPQEARRVAEVHPGERYTPEVVIERLAREVARYEPK